MAEFQVNGGAGVAERQLQYEARDRARRELKGRMDSAARMMEQAAIDLQKPSLPDENRESIYNGIVNSANVKLLLGHPDAHEQRMFMQLLTRVYGREQVDPDSGAERLSQAETREQVLDLVHSDPDVYALSMLTAPDDEFGTLGRKWRDYIDNRIDMLPSREEKVTEPEPEIESTSQPAPVVEEEPIFFEPVAENTEFVPVKPIEPIHAEVSEPAPQRPDYGIGADVIERMTEEERLKLWREVTATLSTKPAPEGLTEGERELNEDYLDFFADGGSDVYMEEVRDGSIFKLSDAEIRYVIKDIYSFLYDPVLFNQGFGDRATLYDVVSKEQENMKDSLKKEGYVFSEHAIWKDDVQIYPKDVVKTTQLAEPVMADEPAVQIRKMPRLTESDEPEPEEAPSLESTVENWAPVRRQVEWRAATARLSAMGALHPLTTDQAKQNDNYMNGLNLEHIKGAIDYIEKSTDGYDNRGPSDALTNLYHILNDPIIGLSGDSDKDTIDAIVFVEQKRLKEQLEDSGYVFVSSGGQAELYKDGVQIYPRH